MRTKPRNIRALRRAKRAELRLEYRRLHPYQGHSWDSHRFNVSRWYRLNLSKKERKEMRKDLQNQLLDILYP